MDNDISPASLVRTLVIVTWLTLNLAVNFYNKWAFTPDDDLHHGPGFSFPIFYTMWNMVASFAGANLLMLGVPSSRTISWKQARAPLPAPSLCDAPAARRPISTSNATAIRLYPTLTPPNVYLSARSSGDTSGRCCCCRACRCSTSLCRTPRLCRLASLSIR